METKTLSERIAELNEIKKSYEFEPTALCLKFDLEKQLLTLTDNEFFKAMKVIEELQEKNQVLLAKNGELKKKYQKLYSEFCVEHACNNLTELMYQDEKKKVKELKGK